MILKIKNFIKENLMLFILFIVIFVLFFIKLPYSVLNGGGLINLNDRIENYESSGSLNMAYVKESEVNIFIYLLSYINKNWVLEKKSTSTKTEEKIGKLLLNSSNQLATIVAHKLANKNIIIKNTNIYVGQIFDFAKTDLQIEDQIISINNNKVSDTNDILNIVETSNIGTTLDIKVVNNNKIFNRTAEVVQYENMKKIGIYTIVQYDIDNIEVSFENSEYGSSGGMMMTLALYDYLTKEDLTKGRKIAGTGTIDINGEIGEIAGVKYKLKGAVDEKAEIFLVAKDNYKEAIKEKEKNKYNIEIVKIDNILDAIDYLKK